MVQSLSVDEIVEEGPVTVVTGSGLVELEEEPGFDVCPLSAKLFHVTLYPLK